jgi:hypothetical protein
MMRIRNPGTRDCLLAGAKNSDDEHSTVPTVTTNTVDALKY